MAAARGDQTAAGQGWSSDLTPSMGGVVTQTVSYTDSQGTRWLFPYEGSLTATSPYTQYSAPPGQSWALTTTASLTGTTGYVLADFLTGETWQFDGQGRLTSDTDAHSNTNQLVYGPSGPTSETNYNSGDNTPAVGSRRSLAFSYNANGLLADAQSPLWQAGGTSQAGSQRVSYGYTPATVRTTVDDGVQGGGPDQFSYVGAGWIHCTTPPAGPNCDPSYYDATNSADNVANEYATLAFTGTGIHVYATEYSNRGIAALSVDGGAETQVDLYAPTTRGDVPVYTSPTLAYGAHTLKIRVTGTKDASSGATYVTVDRVDISAPGAPQLTTLTRGAGSTDALTATFGYSGTQLISVTTPYTGYPQAWTLGYDAQGRVVSVTSPISGTPGQAGYTPAYTTQFTYGMSQTVVVAGVGTGGALTHTYTLDAAGNAPQLTDVEGQGHIRTASFDTDHDVLSGTDALDNTTVYTYTYVGASGSVGLLTEEDQPAIHDGDVTAPLTPVVTRYRYDPATYDRLEEDRPNGGVLSYTYDGHHSVATTTERVQANCPTCGTYQYRGTVTQYDRYGELIAATDGRGVDATDDGVAALDPTIGPLYTRHYIYDAQGDQTAEGTPPITTTLSGGTVQANAPVTTTTGYDADGNPITTTTANGNTGSSAYDHLGRLVQTSDPAVTLFDGSTVAPTGTTGYDGDGNVVRSTDASGATTLDSYDPLGRLVAETDPVTGTTLMTYTATRDVADQDPGGQVTRYRYNPTGEVIEVDDPVSGTVQYQYNGVGNTVVITTLDGLSGVPAALATQGYDALNRVVTDTVGGAGVVTQTTLTAYDLDGNVTRVLNQPTGDDRVDVYDLADQQTTLILDPSGNDQSYGYDPAGNRTLTDDFDARLHQDSYDADNRVVQRQDSTLSGTPTMTDTLQFDPDGNTVGETQQATGGAPQTRSAVYNADDWRTQATEDGATTGYGYDALGRGRSESLLGGTSPVTLTRLLDPEERTLAIGERTGVNPTQSYTSTFGYDARNLPVTVTMPGGVGESAQYDAGGRLVGVGASGPATATDVLSSTYSYGYTPFGETGAVTATLNGQATTQRYSYDALGRLTGVAGGPQWSYDADDNISTTVTGGVTTTYQYGGAPNQLQAVVTPGQPTVHYGYDKNGNTTSITSTGGISTSLGYDSRARLASVTLADGTHVSVGYTASGRRGRYTVTKGGATTLDERFTYRGGELAQTVVTGTSVTTPYTDTYAYTQEGGPLELVRQLQGGALARYWYALDGRGNVVALTDSSGAVVDRYSYDPWGQPTSTSESVPQPFRYAGYWYDKELGWYWLSVRHYDPALGRFLQPDPSGEDGVHTYVYAGDAPLDGTDAQGLGLCEVPLLGGVVCTAGRVAHAAWQFVAGDDLQTITDPNANFGAKAFAVVDLASNALLVIPIVGEGAEGIKFGVKGLYYVGRKLVARKFTREELDQALRKGFRKVRTTAEEDVPCQCFPAGTRVATSGGGKAIAGLHVGDTVLAEDPATRKVEAEPVQAVIKDGVKPLLAIALSDGSAITVTANHPFWLDLAPSAGVGGWLPAGQLHVGDRLRTASGRDVTVTGVRRHVGQALVYTLTVAKDHTFFVGTAKVLVHNCPRPSNLFPEQASPNAVLKRYDASGRLTNYEVYDSDGLPIKRVDLVGRPHGGVPTPHVLEFERHVNPRTGETFVNKPRRVRPARPDELTPPR